MRYEDIVERPIMEVKYDVAVYPFRSDSLATKISLQILTLKYHVVFSSFSFAVECMMRWRKDGIYKWVKPNTPKAIEPNLGPGGQTIPASGLSCSIRRMAESTSRLVGTSQGHQTGG